MKNKVFVNSFSFGIMCFSLILIFNVSNLAGMLGITFHAAKRAIDIINSASTVVTIISFICIIVGKGAITTAILSIAKRYIAKHGIKFAASW